MKLNTFKKIKLLLTIFVTVNFVIAIVTNNIYLALIAIVIGLLLLMFVRSKVKDVVVDERIKQIALFAYRNAFLISTVILAGFSIMFIVFSRDSNQIIMETIGTIMSYISLFNIAIYVMSYKYYSKKYGDKQ